MELLPDDSHDVITADAEMSDDGAMRTEVTGPPAGRVIPLRRRNIVDDRAAHATSPDDMLAVTRALRTRNAKSVSVPNVCGVMVRLHVVELAMPRRVHVAWSAADVMHTGITR